MPNYRAIYRIRHDEDDTWDLLMVLSEACMEENPQFYETFEGDENYMTVASDTLDFPDVWLG